MNNHRIEEKIIEMKTKEYSFRYIARHLNSKHISNPSNGKPWTVQGIMDFLERRELAYLILRMTQTMPMTYVLNELNKNQSFYDKLYSNQTSSSAWTPQSVLSFLSSEGFGHFIRGKLLLV